MISRVEEDAVAFDWLSGYGAQNGFGCYVSQENNGLRPHQPDLISQIRITRSYLIRFRQTVFWGKHFTTEVMYTFLRSILARSSISSRNFPALPTNGFPVSSSFLPGACPMSMILAGQGPSPGTACFLPLQSLHSKHLRTRAAIRSISFIAYAIGRKG